MKVPVGPGAEQVAEYIIINKIDRVPVFMGFILKCGTSAKQILSKEYIHK